MPRFLTMQGGVSPGSASDLWTARVELILSEAFPEMKIRRLPGGTRDAAIRMLNREMDFGLPGTAANLGAVYFGDLKGFEGQRALSLRQVAWQDVGNMMTTFVVLRDSPIQKIEDLWNKKIGVGPMGGAIGITTERLFSYWGVTFKDIEKKGGMIYWGDTTGSMELLAEGKLDAFTYGMNHPFPAYMKVNETRGIRFIDIPEEAVKHLATLERERCVAVLAAGTYKGQDKPAKGYTVANFFWVAADLPDDVVFNICAALFKTKNMFEGLAGHEGRDMVTYATSLPPYIPLHPGAVKYWKARGVPESQLTYTGPP